MRIKTSPKRAILITIFLGLTLSTMLLVYLTSKSSVEENPQLPVLSVVENAVEFSSQEEVDVGLPVRLKIPSIGIDSPFEYVGLTADGAMDVPKKQANAAWFELGRRPGEDGSAVIAGHYGWRNIKSVFDDLHKLRKGDKIYIEDDNGDTISFVVRESRRYNPQADASDVFGLNDGKAHLNLVTCVGFWNKTEKSYSERLVVFADKEEITSQTLP